MTVDEIIKESKLLSIDNRRNSLIKLIEEINKHIEISDTSKINNLKKFLETIENMANNYNEKEFEAARKYVERISIEIKSDIEGNH